MKISGFTIIRNAVINDYPVKEAILSILPIVDEMIILVGNSDDDTGGLIRSIDSDKIRIHDSVWDPNLKKGGLVLAVETDKAFKKISPESDWAFYIQADEVLHEKYHETVRQEAEKYKNEKEVEGLLFNYVHFYGTYDYVGDSRKWYNREIRLIRNDPAIHSYRDAQGFRKNGKKLKVKPIPAEIYHYGWVKDPRQMLIKKHNLSKLWDEAPPDEAVLKANAVFDYSEFDSLARFTGTHPEVMQSRITRQNWKVDVDISKKKFSFKDGLLYWLEKKTGKRLFEYKNYQII